VLIDPKVQTTVVKSVALDETLAADSLRSTASERQRAETAALPSVGDIVGEHYRLVRILGEGMFGKVYVAQRVDVPEHQVALKLLPRSLYADRNVERELVMLASVGHPNVVQLMDHGTPAHYVWLTMPVYQGETLAERLERGPLDLREAHDVFLSVARGLEALHDAGLRHQDVKPENIYLAVFGGRVHPILLDLGVAAERTAPFCAGTALYAAPEQIAALNGFPGAVELNEKMDTYCLATTLLMALVGLKGFPGSSAETREEVDMAHKLRAERPLGEDVLPDLTGPPRELIEGAFQRWLSLEALERPSMSQLAEQLDVLLEPEREAERAEDLRLARQKTSLLRNRIVIGGLLLVGAAVSGILVSQRQTLRLAAELQKERHGREEQFDKLDTCAASYRVASDAAEACAAARQLDQAELKKALDGVEKNGTAAEADRARELQGIATRLKTCEDSLASAQPRCADETSKIVNDCAVEKVGIASARDAAKEDAEAKGHEIVALEHQRDVAAAEKNACVIERDACRSSILRPLPGVVRPASVASGAPAAGGPGTGAPIAPPPPPSPPTSPPSPPPSPPGP
jgi:eukaryotic-like serine/threonine-protein kinase